MGLANSGIVFFTITNYKLAYNYFREAAALVPSNPYYWADMGDCLWRLGNYRDAVPLYRQAVQLGIGEPYRTFDLQAVAWWEEQERIAQYAALRDEGIAAYNRNDFRAAEIAFRRAVDADPTYAGGYYNVALSLIYQYNGAEALSWARRAVQLDSSYTQAYWAIDVSLLLLGQFDEAEQRARVGLQINPFDSDLKRIVNSAQSARTILHIADTLDGKPKYAYNPITDQTQCSLFVRDFGRLFNGERPLPELEGQVKNQIPALTGSWLELSYDAQDPTDAFREAVVAANTGHLVVVAWENPTPTDYNTGHIAVILPQAFSDFYLSDHDHWGMRVPWIAQAGDKGATSALSEMY